MKNNNRLAIACVLAAFISGNAAFAQEDAIKVIADQACECASKINVNLAKDKVIEEINSCISVASLSAQLKKINLETESATVIDTTSAKKEYTITLGGDTEEIQAYIRKNCQAVNILMSSNNVELDHSFSKNKKAMKFYEEGLAYSQEKKYDMAIVSYNKAVKADPKFAFAWDNMGITYRRMGSYEQAIKCYQKSLELDPHGPMPLQNTAIAYEYLKDYKKAAATYEKFITLHPDNPEGYYGAGRTFYLCENYAKGIDYMFKAYNMYGEVNSPYFQDAQQSIAFYYNDLKEKGKLDIFTEAAKKNNINIQD